MIHLRDITMQDLALYERLLTDPATMSELGGPLPREILRDKLARIVEDVRGDGVWYSVIVTDDDEAAGTVCIWDHDEVGEPITEIGWMVLPGLQGRGLANAAVRSILERAEATRKWETIHAFPGVTNGASNAICRKTGFELIGEREIAYMGRTLRCHHWVRDLRAR